MTDSRSEAIEKWNRRAPRPFTKEEREALKLALDSLAEWVDEPGPGEEEDNHSCDCREAHAIIEGMLDSSKGGGT